MRTLAFSASSHNHHHVAAPGVLVTDTHSGSLLHSCLHALARTRHNRSGSMEPAFQRGDILFLNNQDDPIRVGEVVVFKIKDRDIPIVHRIMKVHEK
jgi:signal peptidase I